MKNYLLLILFLLPFTLLLAGDPPVAIVMKTIKDVSVKKDKAGWENAKIGIPLSTNDEIKTGDKSLALIKFTDNSILRVKENSALRIYADKNKGDLSKNTYIDKGKVGFNVSKQQNEEFKFTTPTMVASIRGTGGYFDVGQDGNTLLVCTEGSINVQATQGVKETTELKSGNFAQVGQQGNITTGTNTQQMLKENNNLKQTNLKRLILKTNEGDLIIEYLGEEQ
ncbi:MAG: FecR family protein [Ignavibacteria bacterium]|nr:FecR family protein [Ignavibacteria bacterium]